MSKPQYQFELIVSERNVYDRRIVDAIEALREHAGPRCTEIDVVLSEIAKCKGNINKARVAKLFGWSASYFRRGFKKTIGISFRAKRFQIKMEIAGSLLTLTGMTIEEIASGLGYSERANFERAFKRAYGVTPVQFRIQDHLVSVVPGKH